MTTAPLTTDDLRDLLLDEDIADGITGIRTGNTIRLSDGRTAYGVRVLGALEWAVR